MFKIEVSVTSTPLNWTECEFRYNKIQPLDSKEFDHDMGSSQHTNASLNLEDYYQKKKAGRDVTPDEQNSYEALRLSSFQNWPLDSTAAPTRLARAGFFHTGRGDEVQCFSCKGKLKDWQLGDNPLERHKRTFPNCKFVKGEETSNAAILAPESETGSEFFHNSSGINSEFTQTYPLYLQQTARVVNTDTENPGIHNSDISQYPSNQFTNDTNHAGEERTRESPSERSILERARHPEYILESNRQLSFAGWPSEKSQTPNDLADAGFFYAGFNDNVKCFWCNGGLRNWVHGDDPWTEHARWFPRCEYVKLRKGIAFIESIPREGSVPLENNRPPQNNPNLYDRSELGIRMRNPAPSSLPTHHIQPRPQELRAVKARMDSPFVRTILDMGYPTNLVQRALESRLQSENEDFPNLESLLNAIFELEESGERNQGEQREIANGESAAGNQVAAAASALPEAASPRLLPAADERRAESPSTSEKKSTKSKRRNRKKKNQTQNFTPKIEPESTLHKNENKEVETDRLMQENQEMKEQRICKICMDNEVSIVLLPCGHLVCCPSCAPALRHCPICRAGIKGTVRAYMP